MHEMLVNALLIGLVVIRRNMKRRVGAQGRDQLVQLHGACGAVAARARHDLHVERLRRVHRGCDNMFMFLRRQCWRLAGCAAGNNSSHAALGLRANLLLETFHINALGVACKWRDHGGPTTRQL